MKHIKRLLMIIIIIITIGLALFIAPKKQYDKENPFLAKDHMPLVMAHAGGKGVYPDNTMAAFNYSFNLGVDVLEMDVQMTSDGILVLSHGQNETGNTIEHSNLDTYIWNETYEVMAFYAMPLRYYSISLSYNFIKPNH